MKNKRISIFLLTGFLVLFAAIPAYAGSPSGNNWFQLLSSPFTGGDNTGDGGTGSADDYNYFYVGQTWTETIQINSEHTDASNIWVDLNSLYATSSNLLTGTYFPSWSGQTTTLISGTNFRIKSTGYRTSGNSSGLGTFGSFQLTAIRPTLANYGTSSPAALDINIGTIGNTTESNISYLGSDILNDAEDFSFHVWADTKKPYALNPNPSSGSSGFTIDSNYSFDLRDSKNGEGDNTGVGTGVNTSEPPGTITFNAADYTSYDSFSCSGVWGTNLCNVTVNPPSPSGIAGDTRNWDYNTSYTVVINNFRDYASTNQNQLGDANGPNTMDSKTWTFTTESDTVAPRVQSETPARSSTGNSVSTNVSVEIVDKKTYPGTISGTGVAPGTCRIRISSPTFASTVFQQGSGGVTVTAIDYGYRFDINPATDFGQNETVSVSVYDCQDQAMNTMVTDNYTFTTADTDTPYVDTLSPANDATAAETSNISFHIKDNGTGVDLSNTYFYINGVYYSNAGGAGSVTTNGTRITFGSSLNFNGGNYAGDTTSRSGTANDYTFTIDPQSNFASGEAVPVMIYTRDISGNLMERYAYGFATTGGSCPSGSTYCGSNTTWDAGLLKCTGTGGGGGSSCGGSSGGSVSLSIDPRNASATQIDEDSVLVVWYTNKPASTQVVYGTNSPGEFGSAPNYNYQYSSPINNNDTVYHSVIINSLQPGQIYYFRPISTAGSELARGNEMMMAARFGTEQTTCPTVTCPQCETCPSARPTTPSTGGVRPPVTPGVVPTKPVDLIGQQLIKILNIQILGAEQRTTGIIRINGSAIPSVNIKMTIY